MQAEISVSHLKRSVYNTDYMLEYNKLYIL